MSADAHTLDRVGAGAPWHSRAWGIVGALSVTETVSYGILYYAFAVFLVRDDRTADPAPDRHGKPRTPAA